MNRDLARCHSSLDFPPPLLPGAALVSEDCVPALTPVMSYPVIGFKYYTTHMLTTHNLIKFSAQR